MHFYGEKLLENSLAARTLSPFSVTVAEFGNKLSP